MDGTNHSLGRKWKGKAPSGMSPYLKPFVDGKNEGGASVAVVKCTHYFGRTPGFEDENDIFRIPVQVS